MAVRVKLKIKNRLKAGEVEASSLVNPGFEADRPQLLIPVKVAKLLGLWPNPEADVKSEIYETAGGLRVYVIEDSLDVNV